MSILSETADLVRTRLSKEIDSLRIERFVVGLFFTGVKLSNAAGGVCFTPNRAAPEPAARPGWTKELYDPIKTLGVPAAEFLSTLESDGPLKAAVGIAVLNALSATCWLRGLRGDHTIQMDMDAQDALRIPKEASVTVVGTFRPVMKRLKERGGNWSVVEQDPSLLSAEERAHFVPWDSCQEKIGSAEVLIMTGVTVINRTLDRILDMANPNAEIGLIGPTASLLPEPLFERGVRVIGGVWVRNSDGLLDVLAAGGAGRHFFDTFADRVVIERE